MKWKCKKNGMENGEKRGAGLFNFSFDMGVVGGGGGTTQSPNICNIIFSSLPKDITRVISRIGVRE